ncbi:DUF6165 family protein [Synechococcus sp. AH-603-M21]|nr:DUF6165 family protein [Synechococcus sp. AH-603-M21]
MGTSKNHGSGFGPPKPTAAHEKKFARNTNDHIAKEQQAVALINQGKLKEAKAIYKEIINAGTSNYANYGNLAVIQLMQGHIEEAEDLLERAIKLRPEYTEAHNNIGLIKEKQGDLESAMDSYTKAIETNPNYIEAHINIGNIFQEKNLLPNAISSYKKAITLDPNHSDAHNNLGHALQKQGNLTEATSHYKKALRINPNHTDAHNNLGRVYQEQGNYSNATSCYNKALSLNPNHIEAINNLGTTEHNQGNLNAAISYYNKALLLKPDHAEANTNLSNAELTLGFYTTGWKKYRYRFKSKHNKFILDAKPDCPIWDGSTLKKSQKLLLVGEQGLGDTLQFMRYAIALKQQGLTISICAQTKLHSLIRTSGIDDSPLSPEQGNQVSQGQWVPLLSVPQYLEVTPDNPIITKPYIKTTEPLIHKWKDILSGEQKPIIGINWQGNPKHEQANSVGRSILLEAFAPITNHHQLSLLSLQKGFGSEQLSTCSFKHRFVSCQSQVDETWDFLETAAIVANCNLIITSDTSVAHLAAGMGKTTWLLLKKVPEWRWGLEGETSFWYPSMRLFRQTEQGNWDEVFQRVADELFQQFPIIAPDIDNNIQQENLKNQQNNLSKSQTLPQIVAPISLGELIDKITILQIKTKHLKGNALYNVQQELTTLQETLSTLDLQVDPALIQRLESVNTDLWNIEDQIRNHERNKDFNKSFIALARSVYRKNDLRSKIKKEINCNYGSTLTEEKSYQSY